MQDNRLRTLGVAVCTCLAPTFLVAEAGRTAEIEIGGLGATVLVDDGWQRATLTADMGRDQFIHPDGVYAVFFEELSYLTRRADFEGDLAGRLAAIEMNFREMEVDPSPTYARRDGVGRYSQTVEASTDSLHVAYRFDLVSSRGLTYFLMTWAERSKALEVFTHGAELSEGIRFPDADTEWGRTAVPVRGPIRR